MSISGISGATVPGVHPHGVHGKQGAHGKHGAHAPAGAPASGASAAPPPPPASSDADGKKVNVKA